LRDRGIKGKLRSYSTTADPEKAILVAVDVRDNVHNWPVGLSLEELETLAVSSGVKVVGRLVQRLPRALANSYLGQGKLESLKQSRDELGYNVVILDDELSPKQQRFLEDYLEVKIIDRTALILDIFARRARTREGKVQVELAQQRYMMPRLLGQWSHLERLGGGVGTRGPGESQLETDRRMARQRIQRLEVQLDEISQQRDLYKERRLGSALPLVCLVGYTSAGKSTLLNSLTSAGAEVRHTLFSTLDPLTRRFNVGNGRDCLLSDTVGFIHKLPPSIVAAFRATLDELNYASLLLHVVDISNPLAGRRLDVVQEILNKLDLGSKNQLLVCTKADKLVKSENGLKSLAMAGIFSGFTQNAVLVSAAKGWGLQDLKRDIALLI
jgi:GTP-binding protein HflX